MSLPPPRPLKLASLPRVVAELEVVELEVVELEVVELVEQEDKTFQVQIKMVEQEELV